MHRFACVLLFVSLFAAALIVYADTRPVRTRPAKAAPRVNGCRCPGGCLCGERGEPCDCIELN